MAEIKGADAPEFTVPLEFAHYLSWFRDLDDHYRPLFDGGMHPIGPWLHRWERDSGTLLGYADRRIILAMDAAYRAGMAKIRADYMRYERSKQDRA
jgi:hypothetical protein